MKIIVTEEDIIKGVPNHKCKCPIALAVKRAGFKDVYVHKKAITIGDHRQDLPEEAKIFVGMFDQYMGAQYVEPFEFEIAEAN